MIERERRRLGRAFRVALLAASGPAAMLACSGSDDSNNGAAHDAGPFDATMAGADGGKDSALGPATDGAKPASDGSAPGDATLTLDAFAQGGCYIGAVEVDAGPEAAAVGNDTCFFYYGCGFPNGLTNLGCNVIYGVEDGSVIPLSGLTCWIPEDAGCADDVYVPAESGALTMACTPCPQGGGRRPAGLVAACSRGPSRSRAGAYLAAMAFEEDAAIAAFARMRAELGAMRAPRALTAAAAVAERDETRHARVMSRLAMARGAKPAKARVKSVGTRTAAAVAIENAVEGCVRETYGALALAWQAAHAGDGELRRAFTRIARDEARHAALSWALAGWLDARVDAKDRKRVTRARTRALARLVRELSKAPPASLVREAGLPTPAEAHALLASMTRELGLASVV